MASSFSDCVLRLCKFCLLTGVSLALSSTLPCFAQTPSLPQQIARFTQDRQAVRQFYSLDFAANSRKRMDTFLHDQQSVLNKTDFNALPQSEKIDYLLLKEWLRFQIAERERYAKKVQEYVPLLPFAETIAALEERRWKVVPLDPEKTAQELTALTTTVNGVRSDVENGKRKADKRMLERSADWVSEMKETLATWFRHYDGYKPLFGWWCKKPYADVNAALEAYEKLLHEKGKPDGDAAMQEVPIGRDAVLDGLRHEMIAYSPEDLIKIAEKELAWCEEQMRTAARAMGKSDNWKAALALVKQKYVPPGEQDELVAQQARDALAFLDKNNLVTVDDLCRETWRVQMLSPQEQRFLPFAAYSGQKVLVAYPTDEMSYDAKLMSLRANNIHFSRIVTPHELIPGHHLQGYMAQRYAAHRRDFTTPFLVEGWALYWEMLLWDRDYTRSPEDRIGMLFWRMHRCARIIVSLNFHLGKMKPNAMIDFLVERIGHERDAATSEVRRYIGGNYGPLYQVAYMIGGLQLRALHKELVDGGKMTDRQFHDAVLRENAIPVDMIRAALTNAPLTADYKTNWRFAGY